MTTDELVLFGVGLDQPIPEDDNFWMNRVEEVLETAFKNHDIDYALNTCESLRKIAGLSGKALAHLLYKLKQHWTYFEIEDSFEEMVYPRLGLHSHTIERYIKIAEMFDKEMIPKEFEDKVRGRNMTELMPIANTLAQGYELDDDDWKRIAQAPDEKSIRSEIRDITGKEARKSGLTIFLDNRGSLWAADKTDRKFIGSLEITDDEPLVKKAINRIVDNAGVMRQ